MVVSAVHLVARDSQGHAGEARVVVELVVAATAAAYKVEAGKEVVS